MTLLNIKNLYKVFGPRPKEALDMFNKGMSRDEVQKKTRHTVALQDVTLSIERGETFVVMGLSGSGKSTLIRCINRLIEPTAGSIEYNGEDLLKYNTDQLRAFRQTEMSMVFQRFALFPHRTVADNVAYGLEIQKMDEAERRDRANTWLKTVGLEGWEDAYPNQLSGGMQQRVGIARALCTDPETLLMDEPFSALDPLIRREMQDELVELQARLHKTIIFITHDLDEALRLGDRIAILKDGKVQQIGTPEDILTSPANEYVTDFTRDVNRVRVLTARSVMRKPRPMNIQRGGPRVALRLMEEHGIASIFVVDGDQNLLGMLTMEDAIEAVEENNTDLKPLLHTEIDKVTPEDYLEDLIPIAAKRRWPIAVLDEEERLIGSIPRVAVLGALAGTPSQVPNLDQQMSDKVASVID